MKMLRRLPKLLRFIPGTAQDMRAYFLTLQYWLAGSEENIANMVRLLVDRYADGPRRSLRGSCKAAPPVDYPDVGVYHPRLRGRIGERADAPAARPKAQRHGRAAADALLSCWPAIPAHYDGVIAALEAQGLRGHPGLRQRPRRAAGDRALFHEGRPRRRSTRWSR